MNTHDRHTLLLKRLEENGSLRVSGLDDELGVTAMTIWRDMRFLEERGLLRRVRGGAISLNHIGVEPDFQFKEQHAAEEKRRIAAFAVRKYVKPGDTIIVEGGTTAAEILNHLSVDKLTLMTNSLPILARAYALKKSWHVHCSGGILSPVSGNFVGPEAVQFFNGKHAQTFFMSATGLDVESGSITDPNPVEIEVKQTMANCAQRIVLLLDSSKIGIRSVQQVLPLSRIHTLVTDKGLDQKLLKSIEREGLQIEQC